MLDRLNRATRTLLFISSKNFHRLVLAFSGTKDFVSGPSENVKPTNKTLMRRGLADNDACSKLRSAELSYIPAGHIHKGTTVIFVDYG